MKSTVSFKQFFYENMTSVAALGGPTGGYSPDEPFSKDSYATGVTQIPKGGGVITRQGKYINGTKRRRRKNKK